MFQRPLTTEDYIYSMLLDNPEMYIITPDKHLAYMFVPGKGMIRVVHDFSWMSPEDIYTFLFHLRRGI